MPAWKPVQLWSESTYSAYRKYVAGRGPLLIGTKKCDCADLSITPLLEFSCAMGLPVTFVNTENVLLCSNANHAWGVNGTKIGRLWFNFDTFLNSVREYINVKSLFKYNTVENESDPEPGDLMIRYQEIPIIHAVLRHHAALVFAVYPAGKSHPYEHNTAINDYPGSDKAMEQTNITQYFMGTVEIGTPSLSLTNFAWQELELGPTKFRHPDGDIHFDFLNSRGDDKRNAELIYFANKSQFEWVDFKFRRYGPTVVENWYDWKDHEAPPPHGLQSLNLRPDIPDIGEAFRQLGRVYR